MRILLINVVLVLILLSNISFGQDGKFVTNDVVIIKTASKYNNISLDLYKEIDRQVYAKFFDVNKKYNVINFDQKRWNEDSLIDIFKNIEKHVLQGKYFGKEIYHNKIHLNKKELSLLSKSYLVILPVITKYRERFNQEKTEKIRRSRRYFKKTCEIFFEVKIYFFNLSGYKKNNEASASFYTSESFESIGGFTTRQKSILRIKTVSSLILKIADELPNKFKDIHFFQLRSKIKNIQKEKRVLIDIANETAMEEGDEYIVYFNTAGKELKYEEEQKLGYLRVEEVKNDKARAKLLWGEIKEGDVLEKMI